MPFCTGLREIKEYFGKLVAAEVTHDLDMDGQTLYELPPDIPELEGLEVLKLSSNYMKTLPHNIGDLTCLHTLHVAGNRLDSIPDDLGKCVNMTDLNLSTNELREIPYCLQRLTALVSLNLKENRITVIPQWFSNLTSLRELNLDSNKISDVPATLGKLVDLSELHLSKNPINQPFSVALCDMTGLRTLKLHESHFTIFPRQFCNLSAITDISFEEQSMKVPPKEVVRHGFQSMIDYNVLLSIGLAEHKLNLSGRGFDEVPPEVCTIPGLTELILDDNLISYIPPQPYCDENREIDIYDVHLDKIFRGVPDLCAIDSLTYISCVNNNLVDLPKCIMVLVNLQTILLDNNQLVRLPPEMGSCTSLTHISMFNNKVAVIPMAFGALKSLKTFEADWASLIVTPPREISKQIQKKGMGVVIDYLSRYMEAQETDELDCGDLGLRAFPQEIVDEDVGGITENVKMITICGNKLVSLPETITLLHQLVALDLSSNAIVELPENIGDMASLEAFYIDSNRFLTPRHAFVDFPIDDYSHLGSAWVSLCCLGSSIPVSLQFCRLLFKHVEPCANASLHVV